MVAESKLDKKHLRIDNGSNVHLSCSPNREPSKLCLFKFSYAGHISCCIFLAAEILDLNFFKILVNRGSYSKQTLNDPSEQAQLQLV